MNTPFSPNNPPVQNADNGSSYIPSRPPAQTGKSPFGTPPGQQPPIPTQNTTPPPTPAPVQQYAQPAPPLVQEPPNTQYMKSGALSVEDAITGDAEKFKHLDDRITEIVGDVQRQLVETGDAALIPKASIDPATHALLSAKIDGLALTKLFTMRGSTKGEQPYIIATVTNEILGLGPLEPLWQDPTITEVIVNGPDEIFVERKGKLVQAKGIRFRSAEHLLEICQRIVGPINRKIDVKSPLVDARLPDGSRVNAVHYALAPKGPLLTIRRFPQVNLSLADLVGIGAMTEEIAQTLSWLVKMRATTLVCGGTSTGKTTMLNALSAAIPRYERVVTIEDSLELRLSPYSHVAAMEARPADASGSNSIPIRMLVKNALRMRPDRIIVGEVRDEAALEMLQACNTGHEGSMSTVHANGANEVVARLAVMVAQGGEFPSDKVDWLVGSALDIIVMIKKYQDGSRRISGVYEVPELDLSEKHLGLTVIPLWEWVRTGTGDDGEILGEYHKINDVSERLQLKLGLGFEPLPTWDDVVQMAYA